MPSSQPSDRILLLSWTIPPETSGSSVIVGNLAKQFAPHEMVVAGEKPCRKPYVSWKEGWPELVYVSHGWPPTQRGARWWRRLQMPFTLCRCLYLVRKHRCSKIVTVFPNQEFLFVGFLTAKLNRAQLYPYFHNTFVEQCEPGSLAWWFARILQSWVFAAASHVFVMSEGMVRLYRERYPHLTCSALVHSFNEDIPEFSPPPRPQEPPRFVLSGNINGSCVEAVVRVCSAVSQTGSPLTILSGTPQSYLTELGLLGPGVRHETVSRDVLLSRLAEGDILILAHGFTGSLSREEYLTIFPTRTIEYLISGRPILAHAPAESFLARYLKEQDCALVVDIPSVEAILAAIERLRNEADLRARLVRNALRAAEMFRAPRVGALLRQHVNTSSAHV